MQLRFITIIVFAILPTFMAAASPTGSHGGGAEQPSANSETPRDPSANPMTDGLRSALGNNPNALTDLKTGLRAGNFEMAQQVITEIENSSNRKAMLAELEKSLGENGESFKALLGARDLSDDDLFKAREQVIKKADPNPTPKDAAIMNEYQRRNLTAEAKARTSPRSESKSELPPLTNPFQSNNGNSNNPNSQNSSSNNNSLNNNSNSNGNNSSNGNSNGGNGSGMGAGGGAGGGAAGGEEEEEEKKEEEAGAGAGAPESGGAPAGGSSKDSKAQEQEKVELLPMPTMKIPERPKEIDLLPEIREGLKKIFARPLREKK